MRKKSWIVLAAFLLLLIAAFSFMFFLKREKHEQKEKHQEEKHHQQRQIVLPDKQIKEFEIEIGHVDKGKIELYKNFAGEVSFNENRLAHIIPPVSGIVREVYKNFGDSVKKDDLLAVLESRSLADLKAGFLESIERLRLAKAKYEREEILWKKKISSEQDYLDSKQAFEEEKIRLSSWEQKLHAVGISDKILDNLRKGKEHILTNYEIRSPFSGVVVEKHLSLGEKINTDTTAFTIADFTQVWVNLIVYQKDLHDLKVGQNVSVISKSHRFQTEGKIDYVSPFLDKSTRTATARVILENRLGMWKPGMFITAKVAIKTIDVPLVVKRSSIQQIDGKDVVFIHENNSFYPVFVKLGRKDLENVEIVQGLKKGQEYVKKNGFILKAELEKESFGGGHSH